MANVFEQLDAAQPANSASSSGPDFWDKTATAVRGFGQGATAGLIQYPQAAVMGLVNGGDYASNLASLRQQNKQLATTQPGQWYGGQLAGAGTLGYITGGASVPRQIAAGVATGGVQGFTEKEDPMDALTGMGIGGGLSVLGQAGSKVVQLAGNKFASSQVANKVQQLMTEKPDGWRDTLDQVFATGKYNPIPGDKTPGVQGAKDLVTALNSGEVNVGGVPELSGPVNSLITTPLAQHAKDIAQTAWSGAQGAAIGYGANQLAGMANGGQTPISPTAAMLGGAATGGAMAAKQAFKNIAGDVAVRTLTNPTIQKVAETLPNTSQALSVGVPAVNSAITPNVVAGINPPTNIFDQLDATNPFEQMDKLDQVNKQAEGFNYNAWRQNNPRVMGNTD